VLAGISDGFLVMDRDLTVLFVNRQGAEMLGRTSADLLQKPLWTAVPAGEGSTFDRALRLALETHDVVRLEALLPGTARSLSAHIYPAGDNLSVFFQDVTERIEAERRAREGDERLRVALEAGRFGVWEWDMVGDRVAWSDRTHELHGIPVGSFGGRLEDFTTLVHPEDLPRVHDLLQTAIRDRIPYEVEFRVRHPDGSVHWLATAGRVLYAPDHRPSRMLGVIWERTQQRLQEETARHAQRMEAIGRLAGGIAHEVNNQMSVVLGFSQFVLKRADLPADIRSDMAEIHRAGERSAAITSQLLAFSRRQLLRPERLDLTDVVSRFERVMKRTVGEGCDLTLRLGITLPRVEADRGQVEQVLLNLALNAADAMPDGGSLTISTAGVQLPHDAAALAPGVPVVSGAYVRLTVTDTGHGMDASVLRHIFEPFFTTKPMGKGTGLGLSTVYGIMKQSGGYVWVDSDPGTGTSVHLDFPVAKAASDSEASEPAFRPTPARGLVMVVEDEPAVRAMVSRVLQEEGYEVVAAQDGQEALSALADRIGVRLVVSDVAMPVMSGRELGDRLARTHPGLPVLYMSGFADEEIISRGLLEPGRPFIQKPFESGMFARRVAELLLSGGA
jgi:two-component system, cell cycle sensor histidine kinase and response regulator CckA